MICECQIDFHRIFSFFTTKASLLSFLSSSKMEQNGAPNHSKADSGRSHVHKAKTSISELDMYCPISDSTVVEFCTNLSGGRK